MDNIHTRFIQRLGGVKKVSEICGVTKGAVSQWKKTPHSFGTNEFLKEKFPNEYSQIQEKQDE